MKQYDRIKQLREILFANINIESAFVYGSFARKTHSVNSDIDIAIVVKNNFNVDDFLNELKNHFSEILMKSLKVELRNKVVLYFKELPKVEIAFSQNFREYDRNYLGSEIPYENIEDTILFDKSHNILQHFQEITKSKIGINKKEIYNLIDKFLYEFESCSNSHKRSDGYQFYFFYNIALHVAVQLNHLSKGETKFNFLPKNFITNTLKKDKQKNFYEMKGTLLLLEANQQKRKLLDFFYDSLQNLISKEEFEDIKQFCEAIYNRDFLWNFRDISLHNPKIKKGIIYRTATMTLFQNENFFESFIQDKKIKTVIDLRAEREVEESKYSENSLSNFSWIHAPFDPWNQSIEFKTLYHQGTDIEIAYRFFVMECKQSIKKIVDAILEEQNATAIHCFAGKDRTGIVVSMLHLLSNAQIETVYNDYLASEMDTKKEYLDIVLNFIEQQEGIETYFVNCGVSQSQIEQLKNKLINGN
jgi:protein tyrosine/serine phosphatase/predicted nucleotidyltransferase